jgi:hypothetical protein
MAQYREDNNMEQRTITVKRSQLLEKLKENRELHAKEYEEAVDEYKRASVVALDKKKLEVLAAMKKLREQLASDGVPANLDVSLSLDVARPTSHVNDYDEVISQTEWDTREEVPLNSAEFKRYVRNDWDWITNFQLSKLNNTKYL